VMAAASASGPCCLVLASRKPAASVGARTSTGSGLANVSQPVSAWVVSSTWPVPLSGNSSATAAGSATLSSTSSQRRCLSNHPRTAAPIVSCMGVPSQP
jgi:hypothetical protein